MSHTELTVWEVGQDLIHCYDELCEKLAELKSSQKYEAQFEALNSAADGIAKAFNQKHSESHGFLLPRRCVELPTTKGSQARLASLRPVLTQVKEKLEWLFDDLDTAPCSSSRRKPITEALALLAPILAEAEEEGKS